MEGLIHQVYTYRTQVNVTNLHFATPRRHMDGTKSFVLLHGLRVNHSPLTASPRAHYERTFSEILPVFLFFRITFFAP